MIVGFLIGWGARGIWQRSLEVRQLKAELHARHAALVWALRSLRGV